MNKNKNKFLNKYYYFVGCLYKCLDIYFGFNILNVYKNFK